MTSLSAQTARLQAIHNSADAATATVDVYLTSSTGSSLLLDDFSFRNASPFINAPAGSNITLGFAGANSTSVNDTIAGLSYTYNLTPGATYILVAEGIVSGTGYSPATPFGISVYGMGRESSNLSGNTDILVHHGSTDAPVVDVDEVTAGNLVNNAAYGDFAGYLELPTANYQLQVKDETGTTVVASYDAPLSTLNLDDNAITVVASGFLTPANNSNGPAFGLYVALSTGGALVALPTTTITSLSESNINNTNLSIFPNPAKDIINIEGETIKNSTIQIMDITGKFINEELYFSSENSINISKLPSGTYFLRISSESVQLNSKFIKF